MTGRLNRSCLLALLAAVLAANLSQLVAGSEIRVALAAGKTMRGFVQRVELAPAFPLALALMRSRAPEQGGVFVGGSALRMTRRVSRAMSPTAG
jgi:hypothetical protein